MSQNQSAEGLTRAILKLILVAACVTAPVFVFGEGFEAKYIGRVAKSNGSCIVLCVALLKLLRDGRQVLVARLLVFGLLALVGGLAWFNGERVHVNVINFVLVTLLASSLCDRRVLGIVATIAAVEMVAIAWTRPFLEQGKDLAEARFEAIVQFLPTFLVVTTILWMRTRQADQDA